MAMSHAQCEHPATPKARAKCRRDNGITPARSATPRILNFAKDDEEKRPKDRERCCVICGFRQITKRGVDRVNSMTRFVCDKCTYVLEPTTIIDWEV